MKLTLITILIASSIALSSCKKDEPIDPNNPCSGITTGTVILETKLKFNDDDFELNRDYILPSGDHVTFSTTQIFLSGIELRNSQNNLIAPNPIVLIKPNVQSFNLGKMEAGTFSGLKLSMGLDSITNHSDPTQHAPGHPLAYQVPSMHWSWNQGYVFALLEGKWSNNEITAANPGNNWYFHIGLDGNYQSVNEISISKTLIACQSNSIKLKINLANLFYGIDITVNNESLSTNNFGLSYRIGRNLANSITSNE